MVAPARRAVLAIVAVAAAAAAAGVCACTLLVGVPDHLTGGSADDAATDGPASDGRHGGTDAGKTDSSHGDDATVDAADAEGDGAIEAGPYPAGSWCAMQPVQGLVLCDDFDHDTLAFSRWTTQDFGVGGTSGFSPTHVSAPYSLDIHVPVHASANFFLEILEKDVPGSPAASSVSLDYQFQPVSWPDAGSSAQIYTASISQGPGSPRVAVAVFTGPGGTELQEQDTDATGHDTFNKAITGFVPPAGLFSHLTLVVSFGATPTATLLDGGAPLITLQLMGNWQASADTAVYLGDWYLTSTPGFEILYDDATIRQQ